MAGYAGTSYDPFFGYWGMRAGGVLFAMTDPDSKSLLGNDGNIELIKMGADQVHKERQDEYHTEFFRSLDKGIQLFFNSLYLY